MEQLTQQQRELAEKLFQLHTNYKKDGDSRKTINYLETKIAALKSLYNEYVSNDNKIRNTTPALETTHPYFLERQKVVETYNSFIDEMRKRLNNAPPSTPTLPDINKPGTTFSWTTESSSQQTKTTLSRIMKQQDIKMRSLYKEIRSTESKLQNEEAEASLNLSLTHMERMMNQITDLHDSLCLEASEDEEATIKYFTDEYYDVIRKAYDDIVVEVITKNRHNKVGSNRSTEIKLPEIQIPHFSGEHMKWMAFHDVFQQLVHNNQALNNTHKINYLKTHIGGQAAKLINHLQSVGANYEASWNIIKERYDNHYNQIHSHLDVATNDNQ